MTNASGSAQLPEPYCQPLLPWGLYPLWLLGTFFLPLPSQHPDAKGEDFPPYPDSFNPLLDSRVELLAAPLDYADVVKIADHWFAPSMPEEAGGMVMVIRILSVLSHLTTPRDDCGDVAYDFDRLANGFQPVPGGNLCTLLWLGYRYIKAFATALRELDARLTSASHNAQFDELARGVLRYAALVPGHDLARARSPHFGDDDLTLWPDETLKAAVKRGRAHLERAVHQARRASFRESRTRIYAIRSPNVRHIAPSPLHLSASQIRSRNYRSYVDSATDILESLVNLLRLSAHVAVQLQRYLDPMDSSLGLELGTAPPPDLKARLAGWRSTAAPLNHLVDLDQNLLDVHFGHSWRETTMPLALVQDAEYRLVQRLRLYGWWAMALVWGILPGEPDSVYFAGRGGRTGASTYSSQATYAKHPPPLRLSDFDEVDLPRDRKSPIVDRLRHMIVERERYLEKRNRL